ncbi:2Fe-2S iron-sulfur cluster-binding protein [Dactylosporangium sp. NPDC051484]|uniref:2Fe-2S iron-sulfur cluster-binding protein n=1 Tax=Dactylosporangium sp. NPDC051484 TaxID=3154942 RepID=UPI00344C6EC8
MTPASPPALISARTRFHDLTVGGVEPASDDRTSLALTLLVPPPLRPVFAFAPGQHLTLRTDRAGVDVRRSYSLCSTPGELLRDGTLRIGVRLLPGGVFGAHLAAAGAGDTVEALPPLGAFVTAPDPRRRRRYVALAAGSGITPVLSLATTVLQTEPQSEFILLYGNRTAASAMFLAELADLKDRHATRLAVTHAYSRDPALSAPARFDDATLRLLLRTAIDVSTVDEWFVCGPYPLVTNGRDTLAALGVPAGRVRTELFHAARPAPAAEPGPAGGIPTGDDSAGGAAYALTVLLNGHATEVLAERGRPVLDAALRARPELPYSCRTGVCGTCRGRVVSGSVRTPPTWTLGEDELAAGHVLTCQATAEGDELTVDFDVF